MAKIIKKAKAVEPVAKSTAAVETEENLFDPLPTSNNAVSATAYPPKKYIILSGETTKRRIFSHTLHKGTDREKLIHFVNLWVPSVSLTLTNPSIRQLQELQSLYTRDRGFNVMKFSRGAVTSYTLYKMRVLSQEELKTAFEE